MMMGMTVNINRWFLLVPLPLPFYLRCIVQDVDEVPLFVS